MPIKRLALYQLITNFSDSKIPVNEQIIQISFLGLHCGAKHRKQAQRSEYKGKI
jgi:hypothetical protein